MKKLLFLILTCFVASTVEVNAQEESSDERLKEVIVQTNPLRTNWFIQGGAGLVYFEGDFGRDASFGDSVNPTFELHFGKWVTPSIGFRAGFKGTYLTTSSNKETGYTQSQASSGLYMEKYEVTNIHLDAMLNLSSAIFGYKEDTFYNCIPYVGLGVMQRYTSIWDNDLAAVFGLLNSFYISPSFDVYLDLTFTGFDNSYSYLGETRDFTAGATVGLTYKFKKRGWEGKPEPVFTGISEEDFARINSQLAAEKQKNSALKSDLDDQKVVTKAKAAEAEAAKAAQVDLNAQLLVSFTTASSNLNNLSKVNVEYYAETIKASNGKEFVVTGYADNKTGYAAINDKISKERAEAVYNALVNDFGVDASQLSIEFKGGVDNMFYDDYTLSRSVILQPAN